MSVDLSQFHQVFFEESFENLDAMEEHLMALDPSQLDNETINSIFRAAHSIKGGAGTFGFSAVADFTHLIETLLDELRAGKRLTSQEEIDLYLQSVDCLRDMLQASQRGDSVNLEPTQILRDNFAKLLNLASEDSKSPTPTQLSGQSGFGNNQGWSINFAPEADLLMSGNEPLRMLRVLAESAAMSVRCEFKELPDFETMAPEKCYLSWQIELEGDIDRSQIDEVFEWVNDQADIQIRQRQQFEQGTIDGWEIHFVPNKNIIQTGNDPLRLLRDLSQLGPVKVRAEIPSLPDFQNFHADECFLSWHIQVESQCSDQDVRRIFEWVEDESEISFRAKHRTINQVKTPVSSGAPKHQNNEIAKNSPSKPAAKMESSSIRVAIDKIDNLINMVGELVITQSMLGQIGGDFSMDKLPRLLEGLGQLEHNTRELQESVMRIRMLPISFAFSRFPRMVRDLSRRLDKQMELVLHGEQTELDKTVMERIGDPLVHLVRNAIDHGIESPAERQQNGKNPQGTITLNAYHQSGNVVIEIQDDGRGINKQCLLDKAFKQGLVSSADPISMPDAQIYDLIFHPGLSTAAEVSDVSGRGVGMDVVKRNIQELNGSVDIKSQAGSGTTITIRLPLTLAILDGQLVRVGGNVYIFPLVSIVESMQIKKEDLNKVAGGCEVFQLRNEYLPVVRLYEIFNVKPDSTNIEESLLVVVEADGEKIGIVVDELSAQQQVVIKSLEQNYQRVEGVSGATILGDGTVSLILDIPGLVNIAGARHVSLEQMVRQHEFMSTSMN